jgi:eukaryotic-like serine/threonine-protein kinase
MSTKKIRPGYIIENYALQEMVGAGGFSTVYKAKSVDITPDYETVIAVKVLHPRRIERAQIRRFRKEALFAMTLNHEHIVKVFNFTKKDGNYFIFMEFLDIDLLKGLKQHRKLFNQTNIKDIIKKSGTGLDYIHKNGIIHKDVNPANILISYNLDEIKITDFGLARKKRLFDRGHYKNEGTHGYIAPERIKNRKSDIYSFGQTIARIYSELEIEIPENISYVIDRATREDPEERFESIEKLLYYI